MSFHLRRFKLVSVLTECSQQLLKSLRCGMILVRFDLLFLDKYWLSIFKPLTNLIVCTCLTTRVQAQYFMIVIWSPPSTIVHRVHCRRGTISRAFLVILSSTVAMKSQWLNSWFLLDYPEDYYNRYQPDLLVTVDFNVLMIPSDVIIDIALNSVQVMVCMTNNTADVLRLTRPAVLVPGVNMMGIVSREIHQTFKNPGVATLGLYEVQPTIILSALCVNRT